MGMPSLSICVTELFTDYDVQAVVRVGSCGGLAPDLGLHDLILASGAYTDSALNRLRFHGLDYAPVADFGLLRAAYDAASSLPVRSAVGLLLKSDSFYHPRPELTALMAEHGVLGIEMDASALYTLAAAHRRRALAVCTVAGR